MKKKFLALSVAALIGGFSAGVSAAVIPGTVASADVDDMTTPTATSLALNPGGLGHILLVPYFSAQGNNASLLSIVNTDMVRGKAVKVRFRGAQNSDDIYDFQLYLSPGDVWVANVSRGADGVATLTAYDNSCTIPEVVAAGQPRSFITSRLPEQKAEGTLEGYIEIFNMADILKQGDHDTPATTIYPKVKHKSDGSVECGLESVSVNGIPQSLLNDIHDEETARAHGFDSPTGGLMAGWSVINVPEASMWSGAATAISAVQDSLTPQGIGAVGIGNFVWFPQVSGTPSEALDTVTADPLLRKVIIPAGYYDLPDLSTPYTTDPVAGAPEVQASKLTGAIAVTSVTNEYITDPAVGGSTDWVFSMPTRRYAVAVDYASTGNAKLVFNEGVYVRDPNDDTGATPADWSKDAYFAPKNTAGVQYVVGAVATNGNNVFLNGNTACVELGGGAVKYSDRSEKFEIGGAVESPATPVALALCGETNVLSFNSTTSRALGSVGPWVKSVPAYVNGWAVIDTKGNPSAVNAVPANATNVSGRAGLPVLGQAFTKASNGNVGDAGAYYGANWEHRFVRP